LVAAYASLLPDERLRVDKMCDSGKGQLTVSLAVRRPLLARATGLAESELAFVRDSKGKLSLANGADWCFNVADTAGCVVLAVARGQALGVDVENSDRHIANLDDFAQACLSSCELAQVAGLDPVRKKAWVLQAWVLKEAYTKRLGAGLSFGFARITTDPGGEPLLRAIDGQSMGTSEGLLLYTDYAGYYIALSAQGELPAPNIRSLTATDFTF
jgi:phosphopantetheinyl transferase